ncbi:Hypothetical protein I595_1801 [Croceitalea dokdonensis DOKDO 023]|uniref:Phosphate-selective porin O and P n=1 Tax=Croceitalea dokdonensis DOKDO 023 TaxID=1300341 RepID=A0A0P7AJY4_9FLAO|nr:hypothetical protein [Croceitalea dokdonensis]KPM32152.1 Hypothetical protein I595_1801 [Croceitalea dokdonensis DOKDO 023]
MDRKIRNILSKLKLSQIILLSLVLCSKTILGQEENLKDSIKEKGFKIKPTPKTNVNFGGAVWLRGVTIPYLQDTPSNKRGFYIDQFRMSVDGDYGVDGATKLIFSSQIRFFSYQTLIHHMWVGAKLNNNHTIKLGVTQVPFGTLPGSTNSFWYSLAYYVGLEDDRDAGIKYHFNKNGWDFHLAYFMNAEYNDASALNRFAPDLAILGDQQNEERNQGNIRLTKIFEDDASNSSELGFSGEIGQIKNRTTSKNGLRWKGALHYVGNYGKWHPKFQLARYVYEPENPDGVDDRLVLIGYFSDIRLVAAKANLLNASIKRDFDLDWWLFDHMNIYMDYSKVYKDEASFADSELINPGAVLRAGPLYIWFDFMWGKNAWFFNDSQNASGPGAGSLNPNKFEFRQNISIEWFF